MIKGFKEFILRGNVIDLAVAVVIGAAFAAIVDTIVTSFVDPLIGVVFQSGSLDQAWIVSVPTLSGGVSQFAFGAILGAVIKFLAVAAVVYFVLVLPMNKAQERRHAHDEVAEDAPSEQELLLQIRDLLAAQQNRPER